MVCFFSPSLKKEGKKNLMLEDWADRMHAPLLGVLLVFVSFFFFNWLALAPLTCILPMFI